ncbi:MAG: class I SAM-dependent methyltransferase [Chloroflexi bacterium]|nr:class I SAM-dependent methyltransferase [Chloroflexota bacterium]
MAGNLSILACPPWQDYELLDSGGGAKLERYGPYLFSRPEAQAVWRPALPASRWQAAHAVFQPTQEESGGHWQFQKAVEAAWTMRYRNLAFRAQTTAGRHLGVFPEQAAHWDWIVELIQSAGRPIHALNLFGYTGLATLAAAGAGAKVTHVDASKKAIAWARENQVLSKIEAAPVRWIVDDALKFIQREARRGVRYDGILLDPPKFGRGPKGEVWEFFKLFPDLLEGCRAVLSAQPLFIVITAYAIRASALSLYYPLDAMTRRFGGSLEAGELVLIEKSAGRALSTAIFARWSSNLSHPNA